MPASPWFIFFPIRFLVCLLLAWLCYFHENTHQGCLSGLPDSCPTLLCRMGEARGLPPPRSDLPDPFTAVHVVLATGFSPSGPKDLQLRFFPLCPLPEPIAHAAREQSAEGGPSACVSLSWEFTRMSPV